MRRTELLISGCLAAIAVILAMSAGSVRAQSGPGGGAPGFGPRPFGHGGRGGFGFGVEGCLNSGKVVAGQGYTGILTYEQIKPVLNGAPIDRTTTESIARDNDGRTQREITLPPFPNAPQGSSRQIICINDPVAGFGYALDPAKMTALQFKLRSWKPISAGAQGTGQVPPPGPGGPRPPRGPDANVTSVSLAASSAPAGIQSECPAITGTQITRTVNIPGNNGQSTPIQIVTTRWYCQAFSMNLATQTTDPLQGVTKTTITINGGGPPAIAVPTGYKIIAAGVGAAARGPRLGAPPPPQP
ncbi:MAG TPA: hypothetical protein VGG55_03795 [Candidatus Acidoferrales bacterium]